MRSIAALAAILLSTGCGGWRRIPLPADTLFAQKHQIQVWEDDSLRILHSAYIKADTLFGVPYQYPPSCDSCRVALAKARIDSILVARREDPSVAAMVLPAVTLVILTLALVN